MKKAGCFFLVNMKAVMKKIYFVLVLSLLYFSNGHAQQDPNYTQYMYNQSVVNPAYAGSKEGLSSGVLYRSQWAGLDGAPKTGTFFMHSPVGKNVGLGVSFISDKIGPVEENNLYADFSYTLNLGGEHKLALGVKAGASFHSVGLYSDIGNGFVPDASDNAFSENTNNTFLNIGAGLFYYTNKYYLGFAVPNMLDATYLEVTDNGQAYSYGTDTQHYFLTGGYVFDLSENTKFKPSFLVKSAFDAPTSFDLSANFLFFDKFEVGATYRLEDSFGGLVNFAVLPNVRVGYAYDHIVSDLNVTTAASHEFMLLFDLNFTKKVAISTRFF